jgi:hypothetical protein
MPIIWRALPLLLSAAACLPVTGQDGAADPAFAKVPFDDWVASRDAPPFRWSEKLLPVQLSMHQRLLARVDIQIDGRDIASRRGNGKLRVFFQISDSAGHKYQDHGNIDLEKVEQGIKASDVIYSEYAFVLPGDYNIAVAVYSTATGEHGAKRDRLHVAQLKGDPQPGAWRDLPTVEFRPNLDTPDAWYLPPVRGRLHLPLSTRKPVEIDVLLNGTPSERASGSIGVQDANMRALIPLLKVISQIDLSNGSVNVALLDLTRQKVSFHQEHARPFNWTGMRDGFTSTEPGKIDVKALGDRESNAAFFVSEVRKRIAAKDGVSRALIVLTSSVAFEPGVDLTPVPTPEAPGATVFYIRYRVRTVNPMLYAQGPGGVPRRGMPQAPIVHPGRITPPPDQLEPLLQPLAPRVFDVEGAEDMRKALASIMEQISRM